MLPLDEQWDSYVRFVPQEGHPVVAELRVFPRTGTPGVLSHHDPLDGQWVEVTRGLTPEVPTPEGGLTSRALRGIHLGRALELTYSQIMDAFERERRYPGSRALVSEVYTEEAVSVPRQPGRKGRDDRFYAAVAAAYTAALEDGSRQPVVAAAKTLSSAWEGTYNATYVRDLLHVARQRGLLTRPPKGRAGGHLTDKGRALLHREEDQ
jgi:hypothetical protein